MQRTELRIRDAFFRVNQILHLTLAGWQDPIRSTSFWKFWACGGCEGGQWKLYVYLLAYKSAEQPWEAPCGLTFTGCSLFAYHHISLCFYSKSLSPSTKRRRGLLIASRWGGASQLNEYKSGDQPVTECWTAGFQDLTPFIIFACRIRSQFTEPKGCGEAEWPLTLSLRVVWPEAEPTCLFIVCFMFVLYYYGPLDRLLTPSRIHLVIQRAQMCCAFWIFSIQCDFCTSFLPAGLTLCMFDC